MNFCKLTQWYIFLMLVQLFLYLCVMYLCNFFLYFLRLLLGVEAALFCFAVSLLLFRSNFSFAYTQVTSSFPFPSSLPLPGAVITAGMSSRAFQSDTAAHWKTVKCFILSFPSIFSKKVPSEVAKGRWRVQWCWLQRSLLQSWEQEASFPLAV